MKKSDFGPSPRRSGFGHAGGDIIEVVIILVVLIAGLFYTTYGLFDQGSLSGSHNRYYEAREDF